jgi:PleD family two-component response regulator
MPYDLPVTASVGSCSGPLTTDLDWKRLYRAADRALFVAKADGRDRARSAPPLACAA